jgi:hypothetical protein
MEVKEKYQVEILNRFAALGNLVDNDVGINRVSESIRENMKARNTKILGYYGLKRHKPWFDEEC